MRQCIPAKTPQQPGACRKDKQIDDCQSIPEYSGNQLFVNIGETDSVHEYEWMFLKGSAFVTINCCKVKAYLIIQRPEGLPDF
ncbi:MAG: hypothetical protein R2875_03155 [Desulfobacterales bacterium]